MVGGSQLKQRIAGLLLIAHVLGSCSILNGLFPVEYQFINNSSCTLTIRPNGQESWSEFTIEPSRSRIITIPERTIHFGHDRIGVVEAVPFENGTTVFSDK